MKQRVDWTDALIIVGIVVVVAGIWQMAPGWASIFAGGMVMVGGMVIGAARHR